MYEEDLLSRVHQDEAKLAYKWEHWAQWDAQRRKDDMQHTSLLEQRRRKGERHIVHRDRCIDRRSGEWRHTEAGWEGCVSAYWGSRVGLRMCPDHPSFVLCVSVCRAGYLREFYGAESSDRILNYRWPGRATFWGTHAHRY